MPSTQDCFFVFVVGHKINNGGIQTNSNFILLTGPKNGEAYKEGFTKEVAQAALNEVKRKGVKDDATFRIVGKGFEILESIKKK